jgi:hypothetical protein
LFAYPSFDFSSAVRPLFVAFAVVTRIGIAPNTTTTLFHFSGHDTFTLAQHTRVHFSIFLLHCPRKIALLPPRTASVFFLLPLFAYKRPGATCVASPLLWLGKEYETRKEYFKPLYRSPIAAHRCAYSAYQSLSI